MHLFFRKLKRRIKRTLTTSIIIAIAVLLFIFSGVIFINIKKIHSFYFVNKGDKSYQQNNYHEAIENYTKALELYPKHVKARYNLANIYVSYEDFESAVDSYKKALQYNPKYINARINLGIVLAEELVRLDEAIKEYQIVVKTKAPIINIPLIYDNARQVKNAKAVAYYNMALAYRDKSLLFPPKSNETYGYLIKAVKNYEYSLKIEPDNYDTQYNLALTLHLLGNYTDALTGYCKAMLIAPLNYEAHYNLAVLLRQKKIFKESAYEFEQAGNIISYTGDTNKATFIYSLFSEVSQMVMAQNGYQNRKILDRLNPDIEEEQEDIFDFEKIITIEDLEEALIKRIKTQSICKSYL